MRNPCLDVALEELGAAGVHHPQDRARWQGHAGGLGRIRQGGGGVAPVNGYGRHGFFVIKNGSTLR
jgi:hypothetical protein